MCAHHCRAARTYHLVYVTLYFEWTFSIEAVRGYIIALDNSYFNKRRSLHFTYMSISINLNPFQTNFRQILEKNKSVFVYNQYLRIKLKNCQYLQLFLIKGLDDGFFVQQSIN